MEPRPLEYMTFPSTRRIERRSGFRSMKIERELLIELVGPESHSQLHTCTKIDRSEGSYPCGVKSRTGTGGRGVDVAGGEARSGSSVLGRARLALALVTAGVVVRRGGDALRNEPIKGDR